MKASNASPGNSVESTTGRAQLPRDVEAHPTGSTSYGESYYSGYSRRSRLTGRLISHKQEIHRFWFGWLQNRLMSGVRVLEVGCGPGYFGRLLSTRFDYSGIDISPAAVRLAKEVHGLESVRVGRAEVLEFSDGEFSAIVAFDLVEHLGEPERFFKEASRVLVPGGVLILSTPNPESLGNRLKTRDSENPPSMYLDSTHVSLLTLNEWKSLADNEFEVIEEGADFIWDLPYSTPRLLWLEKLILLPLKLLFNRTIGFVSWKAGENTLLVLQKRVER